MTLSQSPRAFRPGHQVMGRPAVMRSDRNSFGRSPKHRATVSGYRCFFVALWLCGFVRVLFELWFGPHPQMLSPGGRRIWTRATMRVSHTKARRHKGRERLPEPGTGLLPFLTDDFVANQRSKMRIAPDVLCPSGPPHWGILI